MQEFLGGSDIDDMESHLQSVLLTEIPLSKALGIKVMEAQPPRLVLEAPLSYNLNHKHTAFAGSLNAVATLAGWGTLYTALYRTGLKAQVVIQESAISYIKPVTSDFQAICDYPPETDFSQAVELCLRKGKGRISLDVPLFGVGRPVAPDEAEAGPLAVFSGIYVILRS